MPARFDLVTIETPHPDTLAAFWRAALGLVELEREDVDRWIVLGDPDGRRRLGIQRGHHRSGTIHLDLACDPAEFEAECTRLVVLGAIALGPTRNEAYGRIANLADPDGNLFDLCAYG